MGDQPVERRRSVARLHELVHLDLLELVEPLDAARVPACGRLLPPEARGVRDVAQRQRSGRQYLSAVHVGDRDLGGGHHPQIVLVVVVHGVGEFRELAAARDRLSCDDVRQVQLLVPVLLDVYGEQPVDERSLEAGALAFENVEAGARQLCGSLEVDDAEPLAKLPVG